MWVASYALWIFVAFMTGFSMYRLNALFWKPERIVTVCDFVERLYLRWVEQHKRPSTLKGYRDIWLDHLKARWRRGGFEPPVQLLTIQRFSKPLSAWANLPASTFQCGRAAKRR